MLVDASAHDAIGFSCTRYARQNVRRSATALTVIQHSSLNALSFAGDCRHVGIFVCRWKEENPLSGTRDTYGLESFGHLYHM